MAPRLELGCGSPFVPKDRLGFGTERWLPPPHQAELPSPSCFSETHCWCGVAQRFTPCNEEFTHLIKHAGPSIRLPAPVTLTGHPISCSWQSCQAASGVRFSQRWRVTRLVSSRAGFEPGVGGGWYPRAWPFRSPHPTPSYCDS